MKFLILLFKKFLFVYSINAQLSIAEISSLLKNNASIDTILYLLDRDDFSMHNFNLRTIDGNHRQLIGSFETEIGQCDFLLQQNEKGIYLAVINRISYKNNQQYFQNVLLLIDSSGFNEYNLIHHKEYNIAVDSNALKKFQIIEYGIACGFNGKPTEQFLTMKRLCSTKNLRLLRQWVQNFDYETKVLGATGLLVLEQKGIKLSDNDKKMIAHLKKLNIVLAAQELLLNIPLIY